MNTEREIIERANKYCAEKCGVRLAPSGMCYFTKSEVNPNGEAYWSYPFTIEDPRCREIVREMFQLTTDIRQDGKRDCFTRLNSNNAIVYLSSGATIAEAEIQCILSIVEQEAG